MSAIIDYIAFIKLAILSLFSEIEKRVFPPLGMNRGPSSSCACQLHVEEDVSDNIVVLVVFKTHVSIRSRGKIVRYGFLLMCVWNCDALNCMSVLRGSFRQSARGVH